MKKTFIWSVTVLTAVAFLTSCAKDKESMIVTDTPSSSTAAAKKSDSGALPSPSPAD